MSQMEFSIYKTSMTLIHDSSSGFMRVINNMAQFALIKAYLSGNPFVEKEHVQAVLSLVGSGITQSCT